MSKRPMTPFSFISPTAGDCKVLTWQFRKKSAMVFGCHLGESPSIPVVKISLYNRPLMTFSRVTRFGTFYGTVKNGFKHGPTRRIVHEIVNTRSIWNQNDVGPSTAL